MAMMVHATLLFMECGGLRWDSVHVIATVNLIDYLQADKPRRV